jgi:hypothetical protein
VGVTGWRDFGGALKSQHESAQLLSIEVRKTLTRDNSK